MKATVLNQSELMKKQQLDWPVIASKPFSYLVKNWDLRLKQNGSRVAANGLLDDVSTFRLILLS